MPWHELYKAKENSQRIADEVAKLIKEHSALSKKEIALQSEKLAEDVDGYLTVIDGEFKELSKNIANHKKALSAKSRFLKRHNKNGFV